MDISLETILQALVARGTRTARTTPPKSEERQPTSIRLNPKTRHFLEAQADALNTSLQSIIGMILDGVAEVTVSETAGQLRSIRERFVFLTGAHGLDLPDVVDLMADHGFTLSALGSADRLLDLLTRNAITYVADVFHVDAAWLAGTQDYSCRHRNWYKNSGELARQLLAHKEAGLKPRVYFVRHKGADFEHAAQTPDSQNGPDEPIGVVVALHRSTGAGKAFTTYEVWGIQTWSYSKCRHEVKHLILFCEEAGIDFIGYELQPEALKAVQHGRQLPVTVLEAPDTSTWFPEDYASFRYKVDKEVAEWPLVRGCYLEDGLSRMARNESGLIDLEVAVLDERRGSEGNSQLPV